MNRPKLGQSVIVKAVAVKSKEKERHLSSISVTTRWYALPLSEGNEYKGVYIGWRCICDCDYWTGGRDYDYDETRNKFNYRVVWLFVVDEHCNHMYAFPEDVLSDIPF